LTIKFTQNNKPEFDVSGAGLGSKIQIQFRLP
jgi:hypothetical protein